MSSILCKAEYAKIAQQTGLTGKDKTGFYLDLNTPLRSNVKPEILQIFQNSLKNLKNQYPFSSGQITNIKTKTAFNINKL